MYREKLREEFREYLAEAKVEINEGELKIKVSPKLNKIEINGMQYSPTAAVEKYMELTKHNVEDSFKKLKIGDFINKKTNNKYTIADFKYLNESSDVYDSEYKSDLILKLNESDKSMTVNLYEKGNFKYSLNNGEWKKTRDGIGFFQNNKIEIELSKSAIDALLDFIE